MVITLTSLIQVIPGSNEVATIIMVVMREYLRITTTMAIVTTITVRASPFGELNLFVKSKLGIIVQGL